MPSKPPKKIPPTPEAVQRLGAKNIFYDVIKLSNLQEDNSQQYKIGADTILFFKNAIAVSDREFLAQKYIERKKKGKRGRKNKPGTRKKVMGPRLSFQPHRPLPTHATQTPVRAKHTTGRRVGGVGKLDGGGRGGILLIITLLQ